MATVRRCRVARSPPALHGIEKKTSIDFRLARAGVAAPGMPVDPRSIDEQREPSAPGGAPAPGVPVSDTDYDALKERARTVPLPPSAHEQEDPSRTRKK